MNIDLSNEIESLKAKVRDIDIFSIWGRVVSIKSSKIEAVGIKRFLSIGSRCDLVDEENNISILSEVIGFENQKIILMPLENVDGISLKSPKIRINNKFTNGGYIYPDQSWLGKVFNGLGEQIMGPSITYGNKPYKIKSHPIESIKRSMLGNKLQTGIKAIDAFTSCYSGQKLGIFAPSGTGKSVLISMLAQHSSAEVKVIGLVGERGKEVKEFIDNYLSKDDIKNSIVITATSDQSALIKTNAAYLTLAISEYFRDQGKEVLCIIDSITRFAMAQREVGLILGEYPTSKGYTTSVLNALPNIIERAGPGKNDKSITAFFTVLEEEEGDFIGETLKSFLDGHIILDRKIAQNGRFPAINILKSISRSMLKFNSEKELNISNLAKKFVFEYQQIEELLKLGLYKHNSNPDIDKAIKYYEKIEKFLSQNINQNFTISETFKELGLILDTK